jgi:hypothetical protein
MDEPTKAMTPDAAWLKEQLAEIAKLIEHSNDLTARRP